jgi:hypothetical protein
MRLNLRLLRWKKRDEVERLAANFAAERCTCCAVILQCCFTQRYEIEAINLSIVMKYRNFEEFPSFTTRREE